MNISQKGIDIIKKFEGFRSEKYICPAGKKTIGYGHVIHENDINKNKITQEEAERVLLEDLKAPIFTITKGVHVPLSQNQFDALVSLVYNWGGGNFLRSKGRWFLNQGNYKAAWREFSQVNKANGIIIKGLQKRRDAEGELFNAEA